MKLLPSLVKAKNFLTQLHRYDECKLSEYKQDITTFRDKEFKRHAHLNSIQLLFHILFKSRLSYHTQIDLQC